jgi:hypothetical protein
MVPRPRRPGSRTKVWVLLVLTQTLPGWADFGGAALGAWFQIADLWRTAPPVLGSSCGIDFPALLGWADFGVRPSGPGFRLPCGDVGYPSRVGRR